MRFPETSARALAAEHRAVLLDAYGVLVDGEGAIDGAAAFIDDLNRDGTNYLVLTNDASKGAERSTELYGQFGLHLPAERILTSGSLIAGYFSEHGLAGAKTLLMGPADAAEEATKAGAEVVPLTEDEAEVIIICDEAGYDFLPTLDHVMSVVLRAIAEERRPHLILPNPDLIYPKRAGPRPEFGIAAGSIAKIIEDAVAIRFPGIDDVKFTRLGKPYSTIFEAAERRTHTHDMVMIGDQLPTDIQGGRDYGLNAGLVTWGLTKAVPDDWPDAQCPTHIVTSF